MTITTQRTERGGIEAPDDQCPGTLDVKWAEEALRRPRTTDQLHSVHRLPPTPPTTSGSSPCDRRGGHRRLSRVRDLSRAEQPLTRTAVDADAGQREVPTSDRHVSDIESIGVFRALSMPAGSADEGRRDRATVAVGNRHARIGRGRRSSNLSPKG
jgi:hypothetical protein